MHQMLQSVISHTYLQEMETEECCLCALALSNNRLHRGLSSTDLCCNCNAPSKTQTRSEALLSNPVSTKNVHKYRDTVG